jgi:alkylation response protein AidB-like acyl-CoA dehydrogenase
VIGSDAAVSAVPAFARCVSNEIATFERSLGPVFGPADAPFSFAGIRAADAAGRIDPNALQALRDAGFVLSLLPPQWGGTRRDFAQVLNLARCLTRRQVALMPATMYGIGPLCALEIAGSTEQRAQAVVDTIDGLPIVFGLSEAEAGSELQAGEARCEIEGDGWRLSGRKWMMGSTADARHAAVLARSGDAGPVGLSLFWVALDRARGVADLPADAMVGMRGIAFGGLDFDRVALPATAPIGRVGHGLELTMLCQQPVKLLSTAANLGASETALRCATAWALQPRGARARADYAHVRHTLAGAFADLMLMEAVCLSGARALSFFPGQCSVWTASAKYAALSLSERILADAGQVLAARALTVDAPWHGAYERARRDNAMVHAIDTNPVVNLRSVGTQLDALALRVDAVPTAAAQIALEAIFDLNAPCVDPQLRELKVVNRGGDAVVESLPALIDAIAALATVPQPVRDGLVATLGDFLPLRDGLLRDRGRLRQRLGAHYGESATLIEHGKRYLRVHMATCAAQTWLRTRRASGEIDAPLDDGHWLLLALRRLRDADAAACADPDPALDEAVWSQLATLTADGRAYALQPFPLCLHS